MSNRFLPLDVAQKVTSTSSHTESAAFNAGTKWIRVNCTVDSYIAIGTSPTATTSSYYLPAGQPTDIGVTGGQKLSCLRVGSSDGIVSIAESFRTPALV